MKVKLDEMIKEADVAGDGRINYVGKVGCYDQRGGGAWAYKL